MKNIATRLQCIRAQMLEMDLAALIVPRADEYLGEYIPEHNERLRPDALQAGGDVFDVFHGFHPALIM